MVEVYEDCGRYKSSMYERSGVERFVVGERTQCGSLITEFNKNGEVLDQVYLSERNTLRVVESYLAAEGAGAAFAVKKSTYKKVEVGFTCPFCNTKSISREFDLYAPDQISQVPVVPLYVCTSCGKKFYSMTDEYLGRLVDKNMDLFEPSEKEGIANNRDKSIKEMQEYIIRIFASKKISRIAAKK